MVCLKMMESRSSPRIQIVGFALLTFCLTGACERSNLKDGLEQPCSEDNVAARFFPAATFIPKFPDLDDDFRDVTARYLDAANEASWTCGRLPAEGYRLFLGGGHNLSGIVASAFRTSVGWRKSVSNFQPPRPGAAYVVTGRSTDESITFPSEDVRQALQRAGFWSGPTWQQIEAEGDVLMIEVLDGADHRAVVQAIPTSEFQAAAAIILRNTAGSDDVLLQRQRRQREQP
jgi:hypothetical protein